MDTKRVRTPRLDVASLEHGPADGPAVLLPHGRPDDAGVRAGAPAGVGHWPQRARPEAVARAVLG